ncbi:MAG: hypothetical protein GX456_01830 [Verrucomicrobia bacterium]|nr:hypothetical protein [Verrucomicrobiota bacterium]
MTVTDVHGFLKLVPVVEASPRSSVWLSCDAEAAKLYCNAESVRQVIIEGLGPVAVSHWETFGQ